MGKQVEQPGKGGRVVIEVKKPKPSPSRTPRKRGKH